MGIYARPNADKVSLGIGNGGLFALAVFTIFVVPLFPIGSQPLAYFLSFSTVFLVGAFALEKQRTRIIVLGIVNIIAELIAFYNDMPVLLALNRLLSVVFFAVIVFLLVAQIARTKRVTAVVVLESINGYLLLGLLYASLIALTAVYQPEAYRFPSEGVTFTHDYVYFGFVTFTTLGYGDVVPLKPFSESLCILTSVSGQIYLAVIIAMLVGKFASTSGAGIEGSTGKTASES